MQRACHRVPLVDLQLPSLIHFRHLFLHLHYGHIFSDTCFTDIAQKLTIEKIHVTTVFACLYLSAWMSQAIFLRAIKYYARKTSIVAHTLAVARCCRRRTHLVCLEQPLSKQRDVVLIKCALHVLWLAHAIRPACAFVCMSQSCV